MDFDQTQAIYRQIIDDFKKRIIRNELVKGDKIPSQREYAESVRVNPNTVQRAYREMELMGMVETVRGQGTFIAVEENLKNRLKAEMAADLLNLFMREMRAIGFSDEEMRASLQAEQQKSKEGKHID